MREEKFQKAHRRRFLFRVCTVEWRIIVDFSFLISQQSRRFLVFIASCSAFDGVDSDDTTVDPGDYADQYGAQ